MQPRGVVDKHAGLWKPFGKVLYPKAEEIPRRQFESARGYVLP